MNQADINKWCKLVLRVAGKHAVKKQLPFKPYDLQLRKDMKTGDFQAVIRMSPTIKVINNEIIKPGAIDR